MNNILRLMTLLLLLLCATAAQAQEVLTEVYIAEDESFAFHYPDGWSLADDEMGLVFLSDKAESLDAENVVEDSILLTLLAPPLASIMTFGADTPSEMLASFAESFELESMEPVEMRVEDRTIFRTRFKDLVDGSVLLAVEFSDDSIGIIFGMTFEDIADYDDTILAIASTFDVYDAEELSEATPAVVSESVEADTGEPCTVSVEQSGAAALRVGPGLNRTELSSLPPDEDFSVIGVAEADDGSLWWKLDKEAVLPQSAAEEIWVAQDQVVSQGDCDRVDSASAPPIIPIIPAEPTPAETSTDETGAPAAESEAANPIGTLPDPGLWYMRSYGGYTNCGERSISVGDMEGYLEIGIANEGIEITLDGDAFRIVHPGHYAGQMYVTFTDELASEETTLPLHLELYVKTPTYIRGERKLCYQGCCITKSLSMWRE